MCFTSVFFGIEVWALFLQRRLRNSGSRLNRASVETGYLHDVSVNHSQVFCLVRSVSEVKSN